MQSLDLPSSDIKQFYKNMLKRQTHKLPSCMDGYQCLIAKPLVKVNVSKLEKRVVEQLQARDINVLEIDKSKKVLRHNSIFYSKECSRVKKRNSYTVQLEQKLDNGETIVQVRYYLISGFKHAYAVCDTFASTVYFTQKNVLELRSETHIQSSLNRSLIMVKLLCKSDTTLSVASNMHMLFVIHLLQEVQW